LASCEVWADTNSPVLAITCNALQLVLQRRGAVELSHLYVPKFLESLQEIRLVQNAAVGGFA